jgi:hypothetical protein
MRQALSTRILARVFLLERATASSMLEVWPDNPRAVPVIEEFGGCSNRSARGNLRRWKKQRINPVQCE